MNKIEVYAINNYPWCVQARTLFKRKKLILAQVVIWHRKSLTVQGNF